jgi:hypothetical protein
MYKPVEYLKTYVFNEGTLVLEGVTLAEEVEFVVKVLVDLATGTVLDEETAENTETTHPDDLAVIQTRQQGIPKSFSVYSATEMSISMPTEHFSNVPWHTGVLATLSLSHTSVTTDSSRLVQGTGASAGVCGNWLADDKAIFGKFADSLTGVGGGDFSDFIGIEPNLALSAVEDGSREALLGGEIDPMRR